MMTSYRGSATIGAGEAGRCISKGQHHPARHPVQKRRLATAIETSNRTAFCGCPFVNPHASRGIAN